MAVVAAVTAVVALGANVHYQEKSASAQRESNRRQLAAQKSVDRTALRQRQRETRIRQEQMMQAAANTGTTGSSGAVGAFGSLSTMYAANVAQQSGQVLAMEGISASNQQAASYARNAGYAQQVGSLSSNALVNTKGFQNLFMQ